MTSDAGNKTLHISKDNLNIEQISFIIVRTACSLAVGSHGIEPKRY